MTNLAKKKQLAAKTLNVGKNRIHFNNSNLAEIKEAITKQDIRELHNEGIITIKPVQGRKKIKIRKTKVGPGKIRKTINKRKQIYVKITRKLRNYLKELKKAGAINPELYSTLRRKIKMRDFKSKAHLKEYLKELGEIKIKVKKDREEKSTKTKGKERTARKPRKTKEEGK